jgi:hypothetical protein
MNQPVKVPPEASTARKFLRILYCHARPPNPSIGLCAAASRGLPVLAPKTSQTCSVRASPARSAEVPVATPAPDA